jgi:hypothetical protein
VTLGEDNLIRPLDTWLVQEFSPLQRRHTIAKLVEQATTDASTPPLSPEGLTVAACDAKLARYRAALDAGADPAVVAAWIADTQAERQRADEREHTAIREALDGDTSEILTEEEVVAIVEELGDMITVLRDAEPEHKLDVYRNLGLRLTYNPETQTVRADIDLAPHRWPSVRVRSPTRAIFTRSLHPESWNFTV